jgi:ubiquinone/menaquinone biosynthesis C-methylase UbiE
MHENPPASDQPTVQLKQRAIEYFRSTSEIYNERYAVKAGGDVLWARHNAVLEEVKRWNLAAGARLLDVGCGPGFMTRDLARLGYQGLGVDTSAAMIEYCKREAETQGIASNWAYQSGDAEALPLLDAQFDGAVCMGVIDYLPSDDNLLAEVARVLKPGGRFLLCVTNRFGYTVSLSELIHWAKKMPGMAAAASRVRKYLVGGKHGAMEFTFRPRKHRPAAARESLRKQGFQILNDRYTHFSLLPAPFCTITSKLNLGIDEKLGTLDRTAARVIGSCYILSTRLDK